MISPYEKCPIFENEKYLLRFIETSDASDLLALYSDEKNLPFFNSDNCNGNFHCTLLEHVQDMIEAWQFEYNQKEFVRWSIIDKDIQHAIGTIELFKRQADDFFNNCGILRLDLRCDYEQTEHIFNILSLIIPSSFTLFNCQTIATKVPQFAFKRKLAIEQLGFTASEENLVGHDGKTYRDYFILQK